MVFHGAISQAQKLSKWELQHLWMFPDPEIHWQGSITYIVKTWKTKNHQTIPTKPTQTPPTKQNQSSTSFKGRISGSCFYTANVFPMPGSRFFSRPSWDIPVSTAEPANGGPTCTTGCKDAVYRGLYIAYQLYGDFLIKPLYEFLINQSGVHGMSSHILSLFSSCECHSLYYQWTHKHL